MKLLKRLVSSDGKREVEFILRDDGFVSFWESCEVEEFDARTWNGYDVYWLQTVHSGIYADPASAMRDAGVMLPWMAEAIEKE